MSEACPSCKSLDVAVSELAVPKPGAREKLECRGCGGTFYRDREAGMSDEVEVSEEVEREIVDAEDPPPCPFEPGQVVRLASGGPELTVLGGASFDSGDPGVAVAWFDPQGMPHDAVFPAACLRPVEAAAAAGDLGLAPKRPCRVTQTKRGQAQIELSCECGWRDAAWTGREAMSKTAAHLNAGADPRQEVRPRGAGGGVDAQG